MPRCLEEALGKMSKKASVVAAWKEGKGFRGGSPVPSHPISPIYQALAGTVAKLGKNSAKIPVSATLSASQEVSWSAGLGTSLET